MPNLNDQPADQARIVASLASECHAPVAEVAALYEQECSALASWARTTQYLHIFAARKVKELLLGQGQGPTAELATRVAA
jgi:hypothetical protein